MAEITTGTAAQMNAAPPAAPAPVAAAPVAVPSAFQKAETAVFGFLQAHYAKLLAAVIGFAASHFGLLAKIL